MEGISMIESCSLLEKLPDMPHTLGHCSRHHAMECKWPLLREDVRLAAGSARRILIDDQSNCLTSEPKTGSEKMPVA